jgi:iron complex outermembrane receptor protein
LQVADDIVLKSISGYRHSYYFLTADLDATTYPFPSDTPPYNFVQSEDTTLASEELQLSGSTTTLKWIAGLYYFYQFVNPGYYDFGFGPVTAPFPLLQGGQEKTNAYAAFSQITYHPVPRLGLTVGLRYSDEDRSVDEKWTTYGYLDSDFGPCLSLPGTLCLNVRKADFHALTPKFGADYQAAENLLLYANIANGFKSGGFSLGALQPAFQPETVWDYELGAKLRSADQRSELDLSAFHYDYTNLQVTEINNGYVSTTNAARSKINGVEAEGTVLPLKGLEISDSFSFLDAKFTSFHEVDPVFPSQGVQDLQGNQLPFSSRFNNSLTTSYTIPIPNYPLRLYADWDWRDKVYFTEFNLNTNEQPAVSTVNAAIRLTSPKKTWYVELFGKNLTDALIVSQSFTSSGAFGRPVNGQLAPPRTYGVTLHYAY